MSDMLKRHTYFLWAVFLFAIIIANDVALLMIALVFTAQGASQPDWVLMWATVSIFVSLPAALMAFALAWSSAP